MARLLDIGLDRISNLMIDMASLSENSVTIALEAYERGNINKAENFDYSEKLRILQLEVADFATELIARYQPVATDLRFIHSCLDISYGFSRFGRYAYDIASLMEMIGPNEDCDKSQVNQMASTVKREAVLCKGPAQAADFFLALEDDGFMFRQVVTRTEPGQSATDNYGVFHECMSTFISR